MIPFSCWSSVGGDYYGIVKHSDEVFSRDDSFILSRWDDTVEYFTVWDFKECTISSRVYDASLFKYSENNFLSKCREIDAFPLRREDPYEILELYDMKTNTYEDYVNGCSFDYEEETYLPKTELCQQEYEYSNDRRLYMLQNMLTNPTWNGDYNLILYKALWNEGNLDVGLINRYYKEIVKYIEKNYDFK